MDHRARVYDSILELLPSEENPTPMVRVNRMNPAPEGFTLYAKLEWLNPFGSVKDRAAWALLRDLEESGKLGPGSGRGIVEPTSGNTGISLATLASLRGYPMLAVVPNRVPLEKKVLLKIAGAELEVVNDELCPSPGMGDGSINLAKTYAKAQSERWAMPNQYENEANVRAHLESTGPEIWRQTGGAITHVFLSLGTCGTATGLGRFLKAKKPGVKMVAVQPTEGHDVPGLRNVGQLEVSKLFDPSLIDEILEIDYELAYTRAVELCRTEGLLAGPSSGLIYEGARRVIERDREGVGVMIFPDDVFKYTSNLVKHLPALAQGVEPEG
ncbi:MAG TPA: cysteine synthase family protein [Thermoanaerobaculia bacterium]|nr:cysteine synthase family protein [Thermoanaerobaculia bacterium]